ncbi:hypothetical protein D3C87_1596200 [compost metagenome]
MILSCLIKDVITFIIWCIMRGTPFYMAFWLAFHINDETPWYVAITLVSLTFAIPYILLSWITVAVPALVWRYRTNHVTRLVEFDGRNYRQVKILGMWFFIKMSDTGSYYCMSSNHWFSTDNLVEFTNDSYKFKDRFETFINAWRFGETAEVLKYQTFEGGRAK